MLKTGKILGVERQLVTKNREVIDTILDVTMEYDEHGKPIKTRATFEDITERKLAEEVLRESEEKYRILVKNVPDIIYTIDRNGNFTSVNKHALELLGYREDELIGQHFMDVIHPDDVEMTLESFKKAVSTKKQKPSGLMFKLLAKDGRVIWVSLNSSMTFDERGRFLQEQGVARDITARKLVEEELRKAYDELEMRVEERTAELAKANEELQIEIIEHKKTEEALRESEGRYRTLFESKLDGMCVIDETMKLLLANQAAADIFSFDSVEEMYDVNPFDFISPEDRARILTIITKDMFENNLQQVNEFRLMSKAGEEIWINAVGTLTEYQGNLAGLISFRDITESKRADEKIKASLREKEMLLQEIHHRVKNNLQVISSLLSLQSEYIKDKQAFQRFKESQDRVKSMALIHEKLYQSKDLAHIDFKGYIQDLIYKLFRSYEVDPGKIALRIDVKDVSLGIDVAIPCGLIINELVSNSLKYAFSPGRDGEIKVALRSIDKNEIELKVKDNGVGLPEDFDFRKTKSLGLHLVTILVEDQLDGRIKLNRSRGTEFKITFKRGK